MIIRFINDITYKKNLVKIVTLIKDLSLLWSCLKCYSFSHLFSLSPSVPKMSLSTYVKKSSTVHQVRFHS